MEWKNEDKTQTQTQKQMIETLLREDMIHERLIHRLGLFILPKLLQFDFIDENDIRILWKPVSTKYSDVLKEFYTIFRTIADNLAQPRVCALVCFVCPI